MHPPSTSYDLDRLASLLADLRQGQPGTAKVILNEFGVEGLTALAEERGTAAVTAHIIPLVPAVCAGLSRNWSSDAPAD